MAKGRLICQRTGCGGPRQVALLIEWESTKAGAGPMRAYTGLEVCRPCAWGIKSPLALVTKEKLEQTREEIVKCGIGSPGPNPVVKYCDVTHPEYLRFRKMRGLH